jgi:hypothetical protein
MSAEDFAGTQLDAARLRGDPAIMRAELTLWLGKDNGESCSTAKLQSTR